MDIEAWNLTNVSYAELVDRHPDRLDCELETVCVEYMNVMREAAYAIKDTVEMVPHQNCLARRAGVPSLAVEKVTGTVVASANYAQRLQRTAARITFAIDVARRRERTSA